MNATNLCEAWTVAAAGGVLAGTGHAPVFAGAALVSLAALALVPSDPGDARAEPA
jgi:hypothetical protein